VIKTIELKLTSYSMSHAATNNSQNLFLSQYI